MAERELDGKVAVVLGGRGAIGGAAARKLAVSGAYVIAADIDVSGRGDGIEQAAVDVTDEGALHALVNDVHHRYERLDILVCAQGIAVGGSVEDTTVEQWDRVYAILVRGYFAAARHAFAAMTGGGSIVFVASKNALMASANASAYCSAKAAELQLARCLAEEGGSRGIRVNTVNPDAVLEGSKIMNSQWAEKRARAHGVSADELPEYYRQRNALKVHIHADDVAEAIVFFASPRSAKCTGNVLNVDGGIVAAYPR